MNKTWEELSLNGKKARLESFIRGETCAFWKVLSKERQKYYAHKLQYEIEKIDEFRIEAYEEYVNEIKTKPEKKIFSRTLKLKMSKKILKIEGEN